MISQSEEDICLTIAEYDDIYLDYHATRNVSREPLSSLAVPHVAENQIFHTIAIINNEITLPTRSGVIHVIVLELALLHLLEEYWRVI